MNINSQIRAYVPIHSQFPFSPTNLRENASYKLESSRVDIRIHIQPLIFVQRNNREISRVRRSRNKVFGIPAVRTLEIQKGPEKTHVMSRNFHKPIFIFGEQQEPLSSSGSRATSVELTLIFFSRGNSRRLGCGVTEVN